MTAGKSLLTTVELIHMFAGSVGRDA